MNGGGAGIVVIAGSTDVRGNTITGMTGRGIAVGRGASPALSGDTSCGNGENLFIADGAEPVIDDTNEICEDAPAEAGK